MSYTLTVVVAARVCTFVKIQTAYFKWVCFIICELYLYKMCIHVMHNFNMDQKPKC